MESRLATPKLRLVEQIIRLETEEQLAQVSAVLDMIIHHDACLTSSSLAPLTPAVNLATAFVGLVNDMKNRKGDTREEALHLIQRWQQQ